MVNDLHVIIGAAPCAHATRAAGTSVTHSMVCVGSLGTSNVDAAANSPETLTHSWGYCVAGSLASLLPAPPAAGKGAGACDYDLLPHLGSLAACVPTSAVTSNCVSDLPAVSQAPAGPGW